MLLLPHNTDRIRRYTAIIIVINVVIDPSMVDTSSQKARSGFIARGMECNGNCRRAAPSRHIYSTAAAAAPLIFVVQQQHFRKC